MSDIILDAQYSEATPTISCGSALTPIYVWYALENQYDTINDLNLGNIVVSGVEQETDKLVNKVGLENIVNHLNILLSSKKWGVYRKISSLSIPENFCWSDVKINASINYVLYSALRDATDPGALQVKEWMKQTPYSQRYGFNNPNSGVTTSLNVDGNNMIFHFIHMSPNGLHILTTKTEDNDEPSRDRFSVAEPDDCSYSLTPQFTRNLSLLGHLIKGK